MEERMAKIVCVHGIGQAWEARETLLASWAPALAGGVSNAGMRLNQSEVDVAFYGHQYRPLAKKGGQLPDWVAGDVENSLEKELIETLGAALQTAAPNMEKGPTRTLAYSVQALARTPFFGSAAQSLVIWCIRQVRLYLTDAGFRSTAQSALVQAISPDTRVVVAHSLGSIVAYEALCAHPEWPVHTLITLGSPLGMRPILGRLVPSALPSPGRRPASVRTWINIADGADVVALQKSLASVFDGPIVDHLVQNGATVHSVHPYLTDPFTGRSIMEALAKDQ
jgi:pimeloyl-ACP methyl ester carboxylesterase